MLKEYSDDETDNEIDIPKPQDKPISHPTSLVTGVTGGGVKSPLHPEEKPKSPEKKDEKVLAKPDDSSKSAIETDKPSHKEYSDDARKGTGLSGICPKNITPFMTEEISASTQSNFKSESSIRATLDTQISNPISDPVQKTLLVTPFIDDQGISQHSGDKSKTISPISQKCETQLSYLDHQLDVDLVSDIEENRSVQQIVEDTIRAGDAEVQKIVDETLKSVQKTRNIREQVVDEGRSVEEIVEDTLKNAKFIPNISMEDKLYCAQVKESDAQEVRPVAYFVNLDDEQKSIDPVKKVPVRSQPKKIIKSETGKILEEASAKPMNKSTISKRTITVREKPKPKPVSPAKTTTVKQTPIRKTITTDKAKLSNKTESRRSVTSSTSTTTSSASATSRVISEIHFERSSSPASSSIFYESQPQGEGSRSTTPRPRVKTDVTRIPYNTSPRSFSPQSKPTKTDKKSVNKSKTTATRSTKELTEKSFKKTERIASQEHVEKRKTPTPSATHRYMQPTLAHSMRYGLSGDGDIGQNVSLASPKSPAPPKSPTPALTKSTRRTQTVTSALTKSTTQIPKQKNSIAEKKPAQPRSQIKRGSQSDSKESLMKSTDRLYKRQTSKENKLANVIGSKSQETKSMKTQSANSAKKLVSKTSIETDNKLLKKTTATIQRTKVPISVSSSARTAAKLSKSDDTVKRPQVDNKKPVKRTVSKVSESSGTMTTTATSTRIVASSMEPKLQKKMKDTMNESSSNSGSGTTSASGSSNSTRRSVRSVSTVSRKTDKDLTNIRRASGAVVSTSTVRVHREPTATTSAVSTVLVDDDCEVITIRSIKSSDSTKSSTSSSSGSGSNSRKVLTSEVFTKTFGPDKPLEVVYRQPEFDVEHHTIMSVRPPSATSSDQQRCINEFDVSFIDTTDSSLSDSVALPMLGSGDPDRLLAASPGSPKPTRSPLALIEETLRRQQQHHHHQQHYHHSSGAIAAALDPSLSMPVAFGESHLTAEVEVEKGSISKETLQERKVDLSSLDTAKISHEIGDVKVGGGDDDSDGDGGDLVARIREEANILVDRVLEESVEIIESQGHQANGHEIAKLDYNSESENYAITCDDIGGVDVIKSPTIESMSGKSFDDNMSFTDEHIHLPLHAQNTTTTMTTTITTQFQQQQSQSAVPSTSAAKDPVAVLESVPVSFPVASSRNQAEDESETRARRIDRKIEKLSTDMDDVSARFDEAFEMSVPEDEISALQGDFSKLSWDESVSPTTNTMADMAQNQITPDNDIQDLIAETGGDLPNSSETDTTPVPPSKESESKTETEPTVVTNAFTTTSHDTPTPKPRVLKASSPVSEGTDSTTIPGPVPKPEIPIDISFDATAPVPKPRAPIKHTEPFENLAALAEQSDSISLRSFELTEDISKTDEPSTELSIRSQLRDIVTTTTVSEDHTESFEPTSEISVDDADTEKSEGAEKTTSFYIGESSRNVIIKTSTRSASVTPQEEEAQGEIGIDAKDISLMKEVSVDSDEANDVFKEFVTMKPEDPTAMDNKITRQGSETRNDILEFENADKDKTAEQKLSKVTTEESLTTSTGSSGRAIIEIAPSSSEDPDESSKEIPEIVNTISEKAASTDKFELPLEKSEWETSEKEIPTEGKPKVVHSPQQPQEASMKSTLDKFHVDEILAEEQVSEDHSSSDHKSFKEEKDLIPSELRSSTVPQEYTFAVESEDISSFIGIPEASMHTSTLDSTQPPEGLFDTTIKETLNKQAAMAHYAQDVFGRGERRDDHGSLGFISTGTAEELSSMEEHVAKEEQASLGFISTETAEDFSSMEDYYSEKLAVASVVADEAATEKSLTTSTFEELSSDQSMKPIDVVVHRLKTETSPDSINRWSIPDVDTSSSSESFHRSFDKTQSRPLSSDLDNLVTTTGTGTSSDYQTAREFTTTGRTEGTEYISAVSTLGSSSLDSQSETSANLASIDVSELSETLVASSAEVDAFEAEEMSRLRDLRADDEDSDESVELPGTAYPTSEQQSLMKRSQEMIFKPKSLDEEPLPVEVAQIEEYPKPKEAERTWGLAYPLEDSKVDSPRESEKGEDILLYHGDPRRSIDESKLASSLDEGSILSVSMSSTSNIDTVVENFDDIIGSAGSSSLTGIEGFQYGHDESIPSASVPEDATFMLEMESKEHSPQDSNASTPPGGESKRRGHKRNESISGDALKNLDKEVALLGEGKESESESDTDPYESEYARQFRSPKERKSKKKKQAAAEMDHSGELEKRPFTPSQLVAEVIVEDSITEELEAEAAMIEERRPSQNMQDYSNIPDIMVTEDIKSPILEEETDEFPEKMLYKVRTEEELHKASDTSVYQKAKAEEKEQDFQRRVQEQYRQKLEELKRAEVGAEYDDRKAPDSPDSFEMVEQPDISDEFVIIEEVAKEANEVDLGGQSIKIKQIKYEQKHDEDVEKIIIKSAPADPKLGSQLYKDDLNFEFEESPPTGASSSSEQQEESDSSETAAANKRWVEMQLTDNQLRYPYDLAGAVLEDIKEEDGEFEVGSSRISSFKDSFSSTPEYDVAARRYHSRGEHDDVSMSSLQEFESLEQAISLENRNRTHQGSTDSSNGSFTRRYVVRHSGSGTAPGDDVSVSSLKDFEGLENACIEAHLIEIKAREEAALLSRSDESNKSNGSDKGATGNVVVTKVTRTVTRTEVVPSSQVESIEALLKQKLEREEGSVQGRVTDMGTTELDTKSKIDSQDSEKDSIDSMEISKSHDMMTSSIESFDISKDATTRSDIDSLEIDKRHSRQESIESFGDEQLDLMTKFVSGGGVTLGDGLTTTTTTTTTSTDADGHEHTVTRVITTTTNVGGGIQELPMDESGMSKDVSVDSLNMCVEQTTSSAGTTATYQTSAGNSQMSGSVTSCASSTLMEDSFPGVGGMSSSQMSASFWSHDESTVVEDEGRDLAQKPQQGH
ncbi:uncharacterized protein Dsimw501_GD13038, isoform N [Drosophila simulans]|uniref:Uncharacterized protein, isoform N n=1 Tax=Drosophila simulans TaxID=7240 RepID=A0A0J9UGF9_DROSI|nr:uncharacterized protein Dsimw501_GD13038, isoform N [Drosophila simulans]